MGVAHYSSFFPSLWRLQPEVDHCRAGRGGRGCPHNSYRQVEERRQPPHKNSGVQPQIGEGTHSMGARVWLFGKRKIRTLHRLGDDIMLPSVRAAQFVSAVRHVSSKPHSSQSARRHTWLDLACSLVAESLGFTSFPLIPPRNGLDRVLLASGFLVVVSVLVLFQCSGPRVYACHAGVWGLGRDLFIGVQDTFFRRYLSSSLV